MIFVTVGGQMPFDRLVTVVDEWARDEGRTDVFAQIGHTHLKPTHIRCVSLLDATEFSRQLQAAEAIITHVGIGTILSALCLGKPILVMPRRGDLRETRNDHQFATARKFCEPRGIVVAYDETQLRHRLEELHNLRAPELIHGEASDLLIGTIMKFLG